VSPRARHRAGAAALFCALVAAAPASWGRAEELAFYAGSTSTDDGSSHSYAWQLEYRENVWRFLDASFLYTNEGHVPGHHRDGVSFQVWAVTPRLSDRFTLALGVGPYFYADTKDQSAAPGFEDSHDVGVIYTGSATWYLSPRWFMRLNVNEIHTNDDASTRTYVLGIGYRLDHLASDLDRVFGDHAAGYSDQPNEATVFGGVTILNSDNSENAAAVGLEYRRKLARYLDVTGSWFNEEAGADKRYNSLAVQAWLAKSWPDHGVSLGFGLGPNFALGDHEASDGRPLKEVVGMASMTAAWRFSQSFQARFTWNRGFTADDQDRDLILIGIGYVWGGPKP
jgi:hypothetical protein